MGIDVLGAVVVEKDRNVLQALKVDWVGKGSDDNCKGRHMSANSIRCISSALDRED